MSVSPRAMAWGSAGLRGPGHQHGPADAAVGQPGWREAPCGLCWQPPALLGSFRQESHAGHRTRGEGEPSWEGSALSHCLTSSKQVGSDPRHPVMGQGGGVRVLGLQAALEQGITLVHGCQGPQGWPRAGLGFCQCLWPFLTCAFCSGHCWGAALGLLMSLSHAGFPLCPSHPSFLTPLKHGDCEVCHSQTLCHPSLRYARSLPAPHQAAVAQLP